MPLRRLTSHVDRLLRGELTDRTRLEAGEVDAPAPTLITASLVLGAFYGVMMGLYAISNRGAEGGMQLLASTLKVPLLFLLTLLVTFPSLYVFSALARSRLRFSSTARLLLAAVTVNLAVLASFGPVTAFFTLSTESHAFMVLLNVVFFAIAGFIGLGFVNRALGVALGSESAARRTPPPPPTQPETGTGTQAEAEPSTALLQPRPLTSTEHTTARRVFTVWLVIFGVVGAQMGWILRPFVGDPDLPFAWFRAKESNFFTAVLHKLAELLG